MNDETSNLPDHVMAFIKKIRKMGIEARDRDKSYEEMKEAHAALDEVIFAWEADLPPLHAVVDFSNFGPAQAAFTLWRVIVDYQRKTGGSVAWEVMLLTPEMEADHFGHFGENGVWRVCFESGPHDWGVIASGGGQPFLHDMTGMVRSNHFLAEPYYSFDLCFSPN